MPTTINDLGIDKLARGEQLALAEELLARLTDGPSSALTPDARRAELARRAAEDDANPDDVVPLEEVKANLRARFGP